MSNNLVGQIGRVTGIVRPGGVGEVTVAFGGGSNAFLAHPEDGESTIKVNKMVVIVSFTPPTTVYVKEYVPDPGVEYKS